MCMVYIRESRRQTVIALINMHEQQGKQDSKYGTHL